MYDLLKATIVHNNLVQEIYGNTSCMINATACLHEWLLYTYTPGWPKTMITQQSYAPAFLPVAAYTLEIVVGLTSLTIRRTIIYALLFKLTSKSKGDRGLCQALTRYLPLEHSLTMEELNHLKESC